MKKYHLAWASFPGNHIVQLGSTDTNLIKWFLDEIKNIVPRYKINDALGFSKVCDLDGNMTYCSVHKLDGKDQEINVWLVQKLLQMGWEPFSVTDTTGGNFQFSLLHMRLEIIVDDIEKM